MSRECLFVDEAVLVAPRTRAHTRSHTHTLAHTHSHHRPSHECRISEDLSRLFGVLLGGELLSEMASAESGRPSPLFASSPFLALSAGAAGGGEEAERSPFFARIQEVASSGNGEGGDAFSAASPSAHPCMGDAQRLCADVLERGRGGAGGASRHGFMHGGAHGAHAHVFNLHQCLADNLGDLAPACHDRIAAAPVVACREDIVEQCGGDVASGRGEGAHHRVRHCLRKALKHNAMREACRASLAALPQRAAPEPVAPFRPPTLLVEAAPARPAPAPVDQPPMLVPAPLAAASAAAAAAAAVPAAPAVLAAAAASAPVAAVPAGGVPRAVVFVLAGLGFAVIVAAIILVLNRSRSPADGYTPLLV